jgi:hypothetical protein
LIQQKAFFSEKRSNNHKYTIFDMLTLHRERQKAIEQICRKEKFAFFSHLVSVCRDIIYAVLVYRLKRRKEKILRKVKALWCGFSTAKSFEHFDGINHTTCCGEGGKAFER